MSDRDTNLIRNVDRMDEAARRLGICDSTCRLHPRSSIVVDAVEVGGPSFRSVLAEGDVHGVRAATFSVAPAKATLR